jgi:hypothetical protein
MIGLVIPRPNKITQSINSKFWVITLGSLPGRNISTPKMRAIDKDV